MHFLGVLDYSLSLLIEVVHHLPYPFVGLVEDRIEIGLFIQQLYHKSLKEKGGDGEEDDRVL